ncbi:GDP-mannose 4,6-dehydratase [Desulfobulbus sp.]|uniref:GDP-mannose 4,6-dehydratase n=1 Tax=Desulfobulbus sp. TaxID=895 RepID=UPI0027BABF96|nr:GDP-mannose 4,6-dehydratase [Desulfobulbus sp.]
MSAASHSDMPRALITGIGGFTGHYLARELEWAGYDVFGIVHGRHPMDSKQFAVDLCDRDQLADAVTTIQPEVVAHLAAISFVAHGDVEALYRINIIGTRNLLQSLANLTKPPRAVLLASSANIYGNAPVEIINEDVPPSPANDYAVSKLAMEQMAHLWLDRLPIVVTRPFNYTGVGQAPHFLLPKIVGHFQRGQNIIELGNIDVERDFSDVRTIAHIYAALLQQPPTGEVFNVCSGKVYSLKNILALMAEIAGYEIEAHVNPAFVRTNEIKRLQGDATRLREVLGSIDCIPLQETLRWMFESGSF